MVSIQSATVNIFHDDTLQTANVAVWFVLNVNGNPVNLAAYDAPAIGMTPQQQSQLDTMLAVIRQAATNKLKADMAGLT
jgi:hypothetical protein